MYTYPYCAIKINQNSALTNIDSILTEFYFKKIW